MPRPDPHQNCPMCGDQLVVGKNHTSHTCVIRHQVVVVCGHLVLSERTKKEPAKPPAAFARRAF